jgi:hypothetical protein
MRLVPSNYIDGRDYLPNLHISANEVLCNDTLKLFWNVHYPKYVLVSGCTSDLTVRI